MRIFNFEKETAYISVRIEDREYSHLIYPRIAKQRDWLILNHIIFNFGLKIAYLCLALAFQEYSHLNLPKNENF